MRERSHRPILIATILGLTAVAYLLRFVQDDAFISFRYAEHLANGQGLVWNVGEPPLEGFTNFSWTLLIAGAMRLGADPVSASYAFGLAAFAGTMLGAYRLARSQDMSETGACVLMAVVGLNASLNRYATGGLETSLQTCLFTIAAWLSVELQRAPRDAPRRVAGLAILSAVLGVAFWTRLDSALVAAVLIPAILWTTVRRGPRPLHEGAALVLPAVLLAGSLIAFKLAYFGKPLPNTFYAKVEHGHGQALIGLEYVASFFGAYGLTAPLLLASAALARRDALVPRSLPLATACLWLAYVVSVGGDFMEYRFIVPILPMVIVSCGSAIAARIPRRLALGLALGLVFESGLQVYATYDKEYQYGGNGIETISGLQRRLTDPAIDWIGTGRALGAHFADVPGTTLAVGAAGAIPFYSKLRTIDLYGLTDAWIARHGVIEGRRVGHTRHAPIGYLVDQKVSFVIAGTPGPPWRGDVYLREDAFRVVPYGDRNDFPAEMSVVELPIDEQHVVPLLYLVTNAAVDARIARSGLRVLPVK